MYIDISVHIYIIYIYICVRTKLIVENEYKFYLYFLQIFSLVAYIV